VADISDVSNALVTLIANALYPNGTGQASAITAPCKVFPGWPNSTNLDADLRAGTVQVSVYPQPNIERVTTRYPQAWQTQTTTTPTLTAAVNANTVTLGGTVTVGHYVTLIVKNLAYSYAAQSGDTLSTVAAALAALINPTTPASAVGPVITFPATAAGRIIARTGAPGTVMRELRRQQRGYQIIIWAPSNALRSAAASVVDQIMSTTDFVTMPDQTAAWLLYRSSNDSDMQERALLYRRDIFFWAEYATTQIATGYPVTSFQTQIELDPANTPDFTAAAWTGFAPVINPVS
jgi:hypothetical protein